MASALLNSRAAASHKLTSCSKQQEAWEVDYEKAKKLFRFENLLGDMVELHSDMDKLEREFREDIKLSPNTAYSYEFDAELKSLCRRYLTLAERIVKTLDHFKDYQVSHRKRFLQCLTSARQSAEHNFELSAKLDQASIVLSMDELITSRPEEFPE